MSYLRALGILVILGLAGLGCNGGSSPPVSGDMAMPITMATVGQAIDVHTPRTLSMNCPLPQPFYDALTSLSVTPAQLAQPDLLISFDTDPNRLHWTDDLRKQGDIVPDFGCMVIADIEAALSVGDTDTRVRELLVAQGIYADRDEYQVSRYDQAITVDPTAGPLLAALQQYYSRPKMAGDPNPNLPSWSSVAAATETAVDKFSPTAQVALAQAILGLLAAVDLRNLALTQSNQIALTDWPTDIDTYLTGRDAADLATFQNAYAVANKMSKAIDYDLLGRAGQLSARSLESLRLALKSEPLTMGARLDLKGYLGKISISLEPTNDTWTGNDFFLLVDGGGNDTYQDDMAVNSDFYHPLAAVLDLTGNDQYIPSTSWDVLGTPTASNPLKITAGKDQHAVQPVNPGLPSDPGPWTGQAAAWFGIAIIDDAAGDDQYKAAFYQASSLFGVAILVDQSGTDTYKGYVHSQGSADFGYAMLVDLGGGNDTYETLHLSQGYGGTRGLGWLIDDAGNDSYTAVTTPIVEDPQNAPYDQEGSNFSGAQGFGFGLRALNSNNQVIASVSGGMGGLFDFAGDDTYLCAVMCQGWGYFFGTGILYDKSGNDSYTVWHKYGIGGANHLAVGLFLDGQGQDTYEFAAGGRTIYDGMSQPNGGSEGVGLGYELSVGFHIDRGPEADTYTFDADKQKFGEVMGIGRFPGFGVLINEGGDDQYHIPGSMGGYALGMVDMPDPMYRQETNTLTTLSVGMFFDFGGNDTYDVMSGNQAANNKVWKQSTPVGTDLFVPALDFGYAADSQYTWMPW